MMSQINHKYITRYIDSFVTGSKLYLIMEYCEKGDLANYLQRMTMFSNMVQQSSYGQISPLDRSIERKEGFRSNVNSPPR